MYTNICTIHGLKVLEQIMKMLAHNLPKDLSLDLRSDARDDSYYEIQCI